MEHLFADRLASLGHPQRLAVLRLLLRRHPDQVAAGDLARALTLPPSTLSSYLTSLRQAGLVTQRREGASLRYGADMAALRGTLGHLFTDCFRGRADILPAPLPNPKGPAVMADRKYNVLFICVGNSARSIFAETLLRSIAGDRFNAYSAGTRPYSELNPFAVQLLQAKGHDTTLLRAKNVDEFRGPDAPALDFVFTVCDRAANEECPAWDGQPVSAHWGMPDPVKAEGTEAQKGLAFQQAYGALRNRIIAFSALPLATLGRVSLQAAVDDLARDMPEDRA